jgi:hypothetical protein
MTEQYHSIDAVLTALYACISGPPGGQDWERDREIYHPRALLTRTRIEDGRAVAFAFSYEEFVAATIPLLAGRSFYEVETSREIFSFGQIAQVFSNYEARETPESAEILFRGVNMIHLWNDGIGADGRPNGRWWIMSIIWDNERAGMPLPSRWERDQD